MTATTLLAFYGALLSSIALVWNFMRDLRDNPRLKVEVSLKKLAHDHGRPFAVGLELELPGASEEIYAAFHIVNVGRRRVTITGLGGSYYTGTKHFVVPKLNMLSLPATLEEGQEKFEMYPRLNILEDNVKRLFVWDTVGRYWKVSRWNLYKVRKEAKKYGVKLNESTPKGAGEA